MSRSETRSSSAPGGSAELFSRAAGALRRGEIVVFPTETFYGLGADALDPGAVERVVALKGRREDSPIAVIIADRGMLDRIVAEIPPAADRLIERFWPGPLTLVLPARNGLPGALINGDGEIGVRVSSHPVAARLSAALGRPLTATSANPSGLAPARSLEEAKEYFAGRIEIFLDGGALSGTRGSTLVAIRQRRLVPIREGEIPLQKLREAIS